MPRFEVLKREPHVWHVLDRRTELVDVIAFPLDEGTVAHVTYLVTLEAYRRFYPGALEALERRLEQTLERAGYRVIRRPPRVDVLL